MTETRKLITQTATQIFKEQLSEETRRAAEQGEWLKPLWEQVQEVGLTQLDTTDGEGLSWGDALSILRVAGAYAVPLPLAEAYLAQWLASSAKLPLPKTPTAIVPTLLGDSIAFRHTAAGWSIQGDAARVTWAIPENQLCVAGQDISGAPLLAIVPASACELQRRTTLSGEPQSRVHLMVNNLPMETVSLLSVTREQLYILAAGCRAALMAGALQQLLDMTVEYAVQRQQFGRPIAKFQAIQQQVAEMAGEVSAVNAAVDGLIEAMDTRKDPFFAAAAAKIRAGQAARIATRIAHQVHGAIGFTDEHPLRHYTRRLWDWRDDFGSEREWSLWLGNYVLNSDLPLWLQITN